MFNKPARRPSAKIEIKLPAWIEKLICRFVQNVLYRLRQGLIGVGEQQGDLPSLLRRQRLLELRHAAQPDAVRNLPICLPGRVVADTNYMVRAMRLP